MSTACPPGGPDRLLTPRRHADLTLRYLSTLYGMYPPPPVPPQPEPHFLERDLAGMPIWGHLMLGVLTLGLYFLILPFIVLFDAAKRAFAAVIAWAIMVAVATAYHLLKAPARALYRQTRRLLGLRPHLSRRQSTPPPPGGPPAPGPPVAGPAHDLPARRI
jgi:hypothetical protein